MSETKPNKKGVYFPGLNALRFFAAFAVIFTHVELIKKLMGRSDHGWIDLWGEWQSGPRKGMTVVDSFPLKAVIEDPVIKWYHPIVSEAGPLGVVFFFVLSGFLITYLLFAERQKTGRISIKAFYLRRIFRIWPLYYFLILLGFFVFPHLEPFWIRYQSDIWEIPNDFWMSFAFFMFMLPNLAFARYGAFPNIGQAWSIGVEEQFYLIWPWMLRKAKRPLNRMAIFLVVLMAIKGIFLLAVEPGGVWTDAIKKFLAMSKLECMALGGLGAWALFFEKKTLLKWFYHPVAQVAGIVGIPFLILFAPAMLQNAIHLVYAMLFLIIILNVSTNPKSILKLENGILNFLGKISYGIYMYHMVIIALVLWIVRKIWPNGTLSVTTENIVIYVLTVGLTILVSYLSYTYLEHRFIKLKSRFTKVVSGDEARNQ